MDLMEQKVHELDARLKQMKEERDQVIQDNEELQEQLDMTNTNNSVGKLKKIRHITISHYVLTNNIFEVKKFVKSQYHTIF